MSNDYFSFTPLTPHTRGLAEAVNDTFTAVVSAFDKLPSQGTITNYFRVATDVSVAVNAYIITPAAPISSYSVGDRFQFVAVLANTGPCTINVGPGVVNLKDDDGTALASGDIPAGAMVSIVFTGSEFRLALSGAIAETSNITINDLGIGIGASSGAAPSTDIPFTIIRSYAGGVAAQIRNPNTSALAYAVMTVSNSTSPPTPHTSLYKFSAAYVADGIAGPNYGALLSTQGPLSIATVHNYPIYFGIGYEPVGSIDTAGAMNMKAFIPTGDDIPGAGMYLRAANSPAWSAGGALVMWMNAAGFKIGPVAGITPSANTPLSVQASLNDLLSMTVANNTNGATARGAVQAVCGDTAQMVETAPTFTPTGIYRAGAAHFIGSSGLVIVGSEVSTTGETRIVANNADIVSFTPTRAAFSTAVGSYSRTVAQLGTITPTAGLMYYCSNEAGGAVIVFGDGTNWRRVTDRAIMS